ATLANPGPDNIQISSEPSGAEVFVNNVPVGKTPTAIRMPRDPNTQLRVELPGYEPQTVILHKSLNPWIFGNICLGGPIGFIVDFVMHNHMHYEEGVAHAILRQQVGAHPAPARQPARETAPAREPDMEPAVEEY
ncbi:MAG: PEGA domain-containing protein, partial [Bradymonadaceae bacterium]